MGSVGGPKWDGLPFEKRAERGLLRVRKDMGVYANLRPALCFDALKDASTLKPEIVSGLDILIVRELMGGVYFGEPKQTTTLPDGQKRAVDTGVYTTSEIERVCRVAFDMARLRGNKVHSAEKSNVMVTGVLWKEVVTDLHKREYSDVELHHILADNAAMQLVRNPKQFDVLVTDNLFGDVLSDEAAQLTGSIGMLPSASLGDKKANGMPSALYEPIHGSAPTSRARAWPIRSPRSSPSPWPALFLRHEGRGGAAGKGGRSGAGGRLSHRRHHAAGHEQGGHHRHDRRHSQGAGQVKVKEARPRVAPWRALAAARAAGRTGPYRVIRAHPATSCQPGTIKSAPQP